MKLVMMALLAGSLLCVTSTPGQAQQIIRDDVTGKTFPQSVSFDVEGTPYMLEATGVATRKKFFAKVYSVAHYLQKEAPKHALDQVLSDRWAKQLTLQWVRSIKGAKIQKGYRESFEAALDHAQRATLKPHIDSYVHLFADGVQKGDHHVLRWIPGGHIEVWINGDLKGKMTDLNFSKALWNIWFGDDSVVDRSRLIRR